MSASLRHSDADGYPLGLTTESVGDVPSRVRKSRGSHRATLRRSPRDTRTPGALVPVRGVDRQPGPGSLPRPASLHALKNWRVRSRLLALVVIPTITAVAAGGLFIASSVESALAYQRVLTLASLSGKMTGLVQALENERQDAVRFIALGRNGGRGAAPSSASPPGLELRLLNQDDAVTDGWASQVKALADRTGGDYSPLAQQDTQAAVTAIGNLGAIRAAATNTQLPAAIVIREYATVISALLAVESQIAVGSSDSTLAGAVRVLGLVSGMKEDASQQQALLISALRPDMVSLGQFGPAQQSAITDAQAQQQGNLSEFDTAATAGQRQLLNAALSDPNIVQAQAQEQQAISLASSNSPIATDPTISDASSALSYVVSGMRSAEGQLASSVISRSGSLHNSAITSAVIYSAGVVLLLGIALGATVIVGRSMVGPLRRLRNGALQVAEVRLPETVRRVAEAGGDGVPAAVEPIDVDSSDEIGEVARAFDQVHQEAVRLAGNEAALRGNVSAMFIGLSRRSVPLIDRLGQMIDSLELTEDDPDHLSDLFSMDHLVTRMRRNSENLLVLAGEEPVRKWSKPVPLADVVRAAASEIEQYGRVQLSIQPGIVISGHVAADVVHLLAEIIENATMFSPPDTPVRISGQEVSTGGVLLEVRDDGVGISPSRLSEINWRLDNPPLIDVSVSEHMGLFAVSRLAARNGIRVRLRAADPRGLSAMTWLPGNLTGRETLRDVEERSRRLAADPSADPLRSAGLSARVHTQQGAAGRKARNMFRAQRPSSHRAKGVLSAAALDAADSVPGTSQVTPATLAGSTLGAPAPGPADLDSQGMPPVRARDSADSERTEAGLPLRTPGANMAVGPVAGTTADSPATDEAQAPGPRAEDFEAKERAVATRQTAPPRRSPELVRNRLSGFQLGDRDAETRTPNAEEGTSR
jgi:signal transduction histidine kinase